MKVNGKATHELVLEWQELRKEVSKTLRTYHLEVTQKLTEVLAPRRLLDERSARCYLGNISHDFLYCLDLPRVKQGRRTFWRIEDLDRYIDGLTSTRVSKNRGGIKIDGR